MEPQSLFIGLDTWPEVVGFFLAVVGGSGALGGTLGALYELYKHPRDPEGLRIKYDKNKTELDEVKKDLSTTNKKLSSLRTSSRAIRKELTKYESIHEALLGDEDELWRIRDTTPPVNYFERLQSSTTRIITVANLKGGVGKTTVASNLCAYLCQKMGKRVLAIDLDYQGSLSSSLLTAAGQDFQGLQVDRFLNGEGTGVELCQIATPLHNILPGASVLSSSYKLARLENRLMLQWLLGEIDTDIRYHLGNVLISDEVQKLFDVVVIDTPPRMTTASINAFSTSHHLVVPAIPDMLSSEPVGQFARYVTDIKRELNPDLNFAGVVISMSEKRDLKGLEIQAIDTIRADLQSKNLNPHIFNQNIPRAAAVAGIAGQDVAYLSDKMFREGIMDHLGDEIAERIGLQVAA